MRSDARNAISQLEGTFAQCQAYPAQNGLVNGTNTINLAAVGICAAGNVSITISTNNTMNIVPAAGANGGTNGYSITVTNNNAGGGYAPLTYNGGGAVTPACQWANGNQCPL